MIKFKLNNNNNNNNNHKFIITKVLNNIEINKNEKRNGEFCIFS